MCGIVGLFLKDKSLEPELGRLTAAMLSTMSDRGPDSAGFAVYGGGKSDQVKLTLRGPAEFHETPVVAAVETAVGGKIGVERRDTHVILTVPADKAEAVETLLAQDWPQLHLVGLGRRMELFKEVGLPADVAERFKLADMGGSHAIGHTRMATESAVTTDGAHPFSTGIDQCLVHNGSLSNHASLRRELRREGLHFETENDSEVAAGYLTWRMQQGMKLDEALTAALADLDGFFTFVVGTEDGFAVLRDPIACKPAVMAETDRYVAFGSEYRALVDLPGIEEARIFEPEPGKVYYWERSR